MHDIWNPWHGCKKCSEGCENCYMYYLDDMRDKDGAEVYLTSNARYPLSKDRKGRYKIQSGEKISVCMTSDFFLEEADQWRGGRVLIPESTYCNLPYGMEGMEILLKVAGLNIELPADSMESLLIASVL